MVANFVELSFEEGVEANAFPPIYKLPPIPAPPATTNAPVEEEVAELVLVVM